MVDESSKKNLNDHPWLDSKNTLSWFQANTQCHPS